MLNRDPSIEMMIDAIIDGRCDEKDLRRLESMMHDPRVRAVYMDQMRLHAVMRWRFGKIESSHGEEHEVDACQLAELEIQPAGSRLGGLRSNFRYLAAAILLGVLGSAFFFRGTGRQGVALLVEARGVAWGTGYAPVAVSSRVGKGDLRIEAGTLTLAFDSGAVVTLEGPAQFRIVSDMRVRVSQGRVTARAEGAAKGFTIETPTSLVVDQGTEFGVEIDKAGRTGVVVFEGLVDVSPRIGPNAAMNTIRHLGQGEGLCIGRSGAMRRIVAVKRGPDERVWSTGISSDRDAVIRSVRDNLRDLESSKYYRIVHRGFGEDVPAYVDRNHQWNGLDEAGIPTFLKGADYVMPFNDDKWMKNLQVTVELARDATLYVIFDNREDTPGWLSKTFTDTGVDIGLDEASRPGGPLVLERGPGQSIDTSFSVWKRDVARGESVVLGALRKEDEAKAMYGIAAQPRS